MAYLVYKRVIEATMDIDPTAAEEDNQNVLEFIQYLRPNKSFDS